MRKNCVILFCTVFILFKRVKSFLCVFARKLNLNRLRAKFRQNNYLKIRSKKYFYFFRVFFVV